MIGTPVMARAASTHAPVGFVRRVFSFPVMLASLLSVLGLLTVRDRFNDPDMWWHLRTGQIIWTTRTIPTTDVFSFTTNHHAYIPHEWLSQISIYGAYRVGGYTGLMLWFCFSTVAVLIAGYFLCTLYSGNAKVAFVGALLIWLFGTVGYSIRPQMLGYFLFIFELLLIQLGRTRSLHWFWGLPPLFALWVNCHGSFFLGLGVASLFFFCSFFWFRIGSLVALPWEPHRRKILGFMILLSVAALFVNPIGVRQILYPLNTLVHQAIGLSQSEEWLPLRMNAGRGLGFLIILAGIFLLVTVQRSELFLEEFMLLALGTWLAVSHQRMLFVFGIMAAPIVSRLLARSWDGYDAAHDRPLPNAILILLSLLVAVWSFPTRQSLSGQVDQGNPAQAVRFIQTHHLSGNMLNDYGFGGYLIWAAPDHPVFVDGRSDVFESTGVLAEYGRWALIQSDPNTLLDQYHISFCLLAQASPMTHVLPLLPNWKTVYSDNMSMIFIRSSSVGHSTP